MKSKDLIRQSIKLLVKGVMRSLKKDQKRLHGRIIYGEADARLHYYLKGLEDGGNLRTMQLYREAKELAEKELKEEALKKCK